MNAKVAARLDEDVKAEIIRRYGGAMLTACRRLLGSEVSARDAVKEAFLDAFPSIDEIDEAHLPRWLLRRAIRAALERLEPSDVSIDALLPEFGEDGHHLGPQHVWPHDLLERPFMRAMIQRKIQILPEANRSVLLLRDVEGLGIHEIAEMLEIEPSLVEARLKGARMALRELIDRELAK